KVEWSIKAAQHEGKAKNGARGLVSGQGDLATFVSESVKTAPRCEAARGAHVGTVLIGCDFGSTTAKAVVLSEDRELLFSCYAISKGNPIEDAQSLFRQVDEAGFRDIGGLALTGYGKDLRKGVLGTGVGVGEAEVHA